MRWIHLTTGKTSPDLKLEDNNTFIGDNLQLTKEEEKEDERERGGKKERKNFLKEREKRFRFEK